MSAFDLTKTMKLPNPLNFKNQTVSIWCTVLAIFLTLLPRLLIWLPAALLINLILIKLNSESRVHYWELTVFENITMMILTFIFAWINMFIWPLIWLITLPITCLMEKDRQPEKQQTQHSDYLPEPLKRLSANQPPPRNEKLTLWQQLKYTSYRDSLSMQWGPVISAGISYCFSFWPILLCLAVYHYCKQKKKQQMTSV